MGLVANLVSITPVALSCCALIDAHLVIHPDKGCKVPSGHRQKAILPESLSAKKPNSYQSYA